MHLKALRERAGLRIKDVAEILRCAESSIRNWEKGRTTPKLEVWQVFRWRDLYQCTEEELIRAVLTSMRTGDKD
ncbi:helix-turn-helix transcriptional regulator [Lyngbya sp. CCY1209]|uniref:helix-turn-helix domain-containing protein n=1 Tax=Lyngbya sp. CCY1209 TaxID=2886103 RepID=UPI002D20BD59|nr:helix-turn-helix transcriptional regulator [Lyngbya sp. CCY1209]MEB3883808.1 helix-turn-helix domain-containing protein [Lyngbya sp. CCY1209]